MSTDRTKMDADSCHYRHSRHIVTDPRRFVTSPLALLLVAMLAICGCSLPRIVVLHDPLAADEHIRLGSIYASQGKTDLARDQYRMATEQDKKNVAAWQLLGEVSYQLKDYKEAERAYGRAMDLDPKNGDLRNDLAWVYMQQNKKLQKAQDLTSQAMELTPGHRPYYLDTLGVIFLKLGKAQESIAALKESVATLPQDQPGPLSEAYLHLSDAYAAAGDAAASHEALQRSRELSPGK